MADLTLDVFNDDAFSCVSLTDAINAAPFVPGRAGQIVGWEEEGVATTTIAIEEEGGELKLLNPSPRGGVGETSADSKRTVRVLQIPHYQHNDTILADSVQNVRAFGQASTLEVLQDRINRRLDQHARLKLDPTLEYQRVGAVKGVILNGDGTTLYNLFNEFGVSQETEIDFNLDAANPAAGVLRKACAGAVRKVVNNLGDTIIGEVHAFCSDGFFDALLSHPEVVDSYKGTSMATVLREGYINTRGEKIHGAFEFGGIVWENYRGKIGNTSFIEDDKCHIFPVGVPGLWRTIYAPADYEDTVNTIGLPRYARQWAMENGKGRHLESQMNAINYCTRPKALLKGKKT